MDKDESDRLARLREKEKAAYLANLRSRSQGDQQGFSGEKEEKAKLLGVREEERANFLENLRSRAAVRDLGKEKSKQAELKRAEHADVHAKTYLIKLDSRSQFRDGMRQKTRNDAKVNEEKMAKLGQAYRGKLKWFLQRYLVAEPSSQDKGSI